MSESRKFKVGDRVKWGDWKGIIVEAKKHEYKTKWLTSNNDNICTDTANWAHAEFELDDLTINMNTIKEFLGVYDE